MKFLVLGALEVADGNDNCTPSAAKVRWTLALLLMRANQVVETGAFIDELWGENPPRSAVTTTQTYIYQLRKLFGQRLGARQADQLIRTQPPGYRLVTCPAAIDACEFDRLRALGQEALRRGQHARAAEAFRQALALWRGPALSDIPVGRLLRAHVAHLEEMRMRTLELRIQADLELDQHRELVPELRSLVIAHPLNEWFHTQLISILGQTGRRGEALHAYQQLRRVLDDELGLEPSPEAQRLQLELLRPGAPAPRHRPARGDRLLAPTAS
jgi:DNA-binding SARP family transcriptional activator